MFTLRINCKSNVVFYSKANFYFTEKPQYRYRVVNDKIIDLIHSRDLNRYCY